MIKLLILCAVSLLVLGCVKPPDKSTKIEAYGNSGNTQISLNSNPTQNNQIDNSVENPEPIVE